MHSKRQFGALPVWRGLIVFAALAMFVLQTTHVHAQPHSGAEESCAVCFSPTGGAAISTDEPPETPFARDIFQAPSIESRFSAAPDSFFTIRGPPRHLSVPA